MQMRQWSITLHGPTGILSSVDTGESQFVVGTETASDVFNVHGDGVTARHAWVWIGEAGLQVEDLGGGTQVNGYQINERVQVEYPASVQVGEITLVIEVKAVQPVAVSPTPSSLDITIPQRAVTKSKASLDVTVPQRTPTRSSVQKTHQQEHPLRNQALRIRHLPCASTPSFVKSPGVGWGRSTLEKIRSWSGRLQ